MIGTGRAVAGLAIVAAGVTFAMRPADPALADPPATVARMARVMTLAAAADERLAELEERLRAAVDAARPGGARIISGEEDPGPELVSAADGGGAPGGKADAARAAGVGPGGPLRASRP